VFGKAGLDAFRFLSSAVGPAVPNATTSEGFSRAAGKTLDLSAIDAIEGTIANDAFCSIGTTACSGAPSQLRSGDHGDICLIDPRGPAAGRGPSPDGWN